MMWMPSTTDGVCDMVDVARQSLYQHIQIFGRDGQYIVRPDNDADSEMKFTTYPEALLWTICFLSQAVSDLGSPAH